MAVMSSTADGAKALSREVANALVVTTAAARDAANVVLKKFADGAQAGHAKEVFNLVSAPRPQILEKEKARARKLPRGSCWGLNNQSYRQSTR